MTFQLSAAQTAAMRLYEVRSRIHSLCEGLKAFTDAGPECNSGVILDFAEVIQELSKGVSTIGDEVEKLDRPALADVPLPTQWLEAVAHYTVARAVSDATPDSAPNVDELVDVWCDAMDALIDLPAPGHAELLYKIELIEDRVDGGVMPSSYIVAIKDDIRQLGGLAVPA